MPRRFSSAEMTRISELAAGAPPGWPEGAGRARVSARALRQAAARAARSVDSRSRTQHNQMARLKRRDFEVIGVPFHWGERLDLAALRGIAGALGRKLSEPSRHGG
jgi:hypothetical protein